MARASLPDLSVTEWAVLAVIAEQPTHGFAVSKALGPEGDLGRIWTVPRPLVYRALTVLENDGLVEPVGEEAGERGPARTRLRATRRGRAAVDRWLRTPVAHVRDLRTQLLLRLRLLDRRGADMRELAGAQLVQLRPILTSLQEQVTTSEGFDRLLAVWRYESAEAAARVLEEVLAPSTPRARRPAVAGGG
ncbi:MAG TPA: PadR family transcriptional regulator [Acidimicrobiales bacterium]|nr:PadR family transcriptional regulator [Acidimicrobiales bacterium]